MLSSVSGVHAPSGGVLARCHGLAARGHETQGAKWGTVTHSTHTRAQAQGASSCSSFGCSTPSLGYVLGGKSGRSVGRPGAFGGGAGGREHPSLRTSAHWSTVTRAGYGQGGWGPSSSQGQSFSLSAALHRIVSFLDTQFLSLILVGAILSGFFFPEPGIYVSELEFSVSSIATSGIFFLSGAVLKTSEARRAMDAWKAFVVGMVSILVVTPLAAVLVLYLKTLVPLDLVPIEFLYGMVIFCCVPTTLSSGVLLTAQCEGNTALALALTVSSNLVGVLTIPVILSKMLGTFGGIHVPAYPLLLKMIHTILIPLAIGKLARENLGWFRSAVDSNRKLVSKLSSILLASVPWIQVSQAQYRLALVNPVSLVLITLVGLFIHALYLTVNFLITLPWDSVHDKEIRRALILVCSQKTLPVATTVIAGMGMALGEPGLVSIPCVVSHLFQIVIDAVLVGKWIADDNAF